MKKQLCECGCGNPAPTANKTDRSSGRIKGQPMRFVRGHGTRMNVAGHKFNRLLAKRPTGKRSSSGSLIWQCVCECGNPTEVPVDALISGHTKSCGCAQREVAAKLAGSTLLKHGHARKGKRSSTWTVWCGMVQRCTGRPSNSAWPHYGGATPPVKVCDRWNPKKDEHAFENFLSDLGPRPSPKHSLSRNLDTGNYEPGNVKWATKKQQWEEQHKKHALLNVKNLIGRLSEFFGRVYVEPAMMQEAA